MTTLISRRKALSVIGGGAAAGVIADTSIPQAHAQGRPFTWASTGGTWGETIKRVFVDPFAQAVSLQPAHSAQLESVAVSKIMASCGNAPFDVSNGSQADNDLLNDSKCIEPYDASIITHLADIYPEAKEGNFYAAFNILLFGLTWNTKEATKPASFKDLLLDKYKGRIGVPAYGWYGMPWLHAMNKLLGGNEDDVTPGITAIAEMVRKNKAVIVENADHGTRVMESGEVVLMPYWNGRTARLVEAKIPAAFEIVPQTVSVGSGFSITKGSQYVKQAQTFIQTTLDPARQLEFSKWSKYPPANTKVKLPPELESIAIPPGALEKTAKLDWKKVNNYRSKYLERWNKEVLNA